jgi:nitrite reductase/ring-hydroxylating ferredoxin subunit
MTRKNVDKRSGYPAGTMKGLNIEGEDVLVANANGTFYSMTGKCSHRGGDLASGRLIDFVVRCPVHGSEYNLRTGQVARNVRIPHIGKSTDAQIQHRNLP